MAKERGTFPFQQHTTSLPLTCFPTVAAPGCHSAPERAAATSPLQPGARPPRGGGASLRRPLTCRGRGAEAAVAGRPPLPASTQATCATSCRRGVSTARITTAAAAAAAAVAALLPRGSRSAPASTEAGPNARR